MPGSGTQVKSSYMKTGVVVFILKFCAVGARNEYGTSTRMEKREADQEVRFASHGDLPVVLELRFTTLRSEKLCWKT